MKQIIQIGMALLIGSAALGQPLFAADKGQKDRKVRSPAAVTHTPSIGRSFVRSGKGSGATARPKFTPGTHPVAKGKPAPAGRNFVRSGTGAGTTARPKFVPGTHPIAKGKPAFAHGHSNVAAALKNGIGKLNRNRTVINNTRIANTRNTRITNRSFAAVSSGKAVHVDGFRAGSFHPRWNRNRVYSWGGHRWRCHDGIWAVIDVGWPGYAFAYPFWYGGRVYGPVYEGSSYAENYPIWDRSLRIEVQTQLAYEGYYSGPIDGIIGTMTSEAIAGYQQDHNLAVTGAINRELLASLGIS